MSKPTIIIPIQILSKEFIIYLRHLHHSLKSCQKQTVPCECLLVDYMSADKFVPKLKKIALKYGFKYARAERKDKIWARGRALNFGIDFSSGNPLFFVDGDCVIPPNYIEEHIKEVDKTTVTYSPFYDTTNAIEKTWEYARLLSQKNAIVGLRPSSYSHVGIHKDWLKKHGGYNNVYRGWGAEDDELFLKFKSTKTNIVKVNTFPVHLWHPTWQKLMNKAGKKKIQKETLKENRKVFWKLKKNLKNKTKRNKK